MEPFALFFADGAVSDLEQLDTTVSRRVTKRIQWLAENFEKITPEPLTGQLTGLFKLRVGDYRVVYEIVRQRSALVIHKIGHRRDIYR